MNFKKRCIVACVAAVAVLAGMLIVYRMIVVNNRYPQRQELSVKQGDFYEIEQGVEMSVVGATWMDSDELERDYDDVWFVDNPQDYKGVEVRVRLKNQSDAKKKFPLFKLYIEADSYDWNGCNAEFFVKKNNVFSFDCELEPGQEAEYTMPYTFLKQNYKEDDWKNLSQGGYFLVNNRYPLKVKWRID